MPRAGEKIKPSAAFALVQFPSVNSSRTQKEADVQALLLPALFALAADAEPPTPPKGAAPQFAYVKASGGRLTRTVQVMVPRVVLRTVVKEVGGKKITEKVKAVEYIGVMETAVVMVDGTTFSTAGGKKLEKEAALKALAKPQVVLLSFDGKPVDKAYLKAMKSDTIVVVVPPPKVNIAPGTDVVPIPLPPPPRPIRGR
jgi:hypothetical protein